MATDIRTQPAASAASSGRLTVWDWAELDPDLGCDLVNGQLERKPGVALWHDALFARLVYFLMGHAFKSKLGQFFGPKSRIRISEMGGREPDIFFVPTALYHLIRENLFLGIPPLVIEILSPHNVSHDRGRKYVEYAQLGIPEYWIVDFPDRCFEVHRLQTSADGGRAYQLAETHRGDAIFRPTLFPGLEIPLADIWPTEFAQHAHE